MSSILSDTYSHSYIAAYGPLSGCELHMPSPLAKEAMIFLTLLMKCEQRHLTLDKTKNLNFRNKPKRLSESDLNLLTEKTAKMIVFIHNVYSTLPVYFPTREYLQGVAEKERMLISMYNSIIQAYNREISAGMALRPLSAPALRRRSFELGTRNWIHEGNKVQVFIQGSFLFSQGGLGLKICLKNLDQSFAEASFYDNGEILYVIDVKSLVPRDSLSNHYNFIDLITQLIFNIWEKQGNDHLAIVYRVSYYSSTSLGYNLDHLDPNDEWKQQINYTRLTALPYFDYFEKVIELDFPIVPTNQI